MKLFSLLLRAAAIGGLMSSFTIALPATAQVGMSPLFMESQAQRGRAQDVLTLINSTDRPMRMRVYSEPFTFNRDGFASLPSDENDLSPYLQFSPREIVVAPNSEQRVRLLGMFPPNLPAGEYRAAVFAEELVDSTNATSNVAIKARVGTTVYMRQGELSAELSGSSAKYSGDALDVIVENRGLATARPRVAWTLVKDGVEVASGERTAHTVIAKSDRKISLALPEALSAGSYTLTGKLDWTMLGERYSHPFELPVLVP